MDLGMSTPSGKVTVQLSGIGVVNDDAGISSLSSADSAGALFLELSRVSLPKKASYKRLKSA